MPEFYEESQLFFVERLLDFHGDLIDGESAYVAVRV
jgi:hypothetical protein